VDGTVVVCPSCSAKARVRPAAPGRPRCPKCGAYLPWIAVADDDAFATEARAPVPVLVDLWADWCGPCRAVEPVLERLATRQAGKLKVLKVDVDRSPAVAARFDAASIPLLVLLRDGAEVKRVLGAHPLPALEALLVPYLE
jgi:thioredoxin 2